MWHSGDGMGWWMLWGGLMMVFFWGAIIALVVWAVQSVGRRDDGHAQSGAIPPRTPWRSPRSATPAARSAATNSSS